MTDTAKAAAEEVPMYFTVIEGQRCGPFDVGELCDRGLNGRMMVWRAGMEEWRRADTVLELAAFIGQPPLPGDATSPASPSRAQAYAAGAVSGARRRAGYVFDSFQKLDVKREVWPLDGPSAQAMTKDPVFWAVTLLAALPLLFNTFNDPEQQLTALALFFAGIWGLIFCYVIHGERVGWGWRIGCLLFTGLIGLNVLVLIESQLPPSFNNMWRSDSFIVSLMGCLTKVGPYEETTKMVPVITIAWFLRKKLLHPDIVLLGIFSGLGFAAFENLRYFHIGAYSAASTSSFAWRASDGSDAGNAAVAAASFQGAISSMVNTLVRSISDTFAHAVFSGIFAHFIALSFRPGAKGRRTALIACGLIIAAGMHGVFDALFQLQPVLPVVVAVVAFMLLRLYLAGSESQAAGNPQNPINDVQNVSEIPASPAVAANA